MQFISQPIRSIVFCLLTVLLLAQSGARAQEDLAARLQQLPASIGENRTITVQPGESWVAIGIRERVGYEHLRRANPGGFDSGTILIPGQHQVAGLVRDGVVINLPELMNFRWVDGRPVARYPVSVGRVARPTPVGTLQSVNRIPNPSWRRPNGSVMAPGPKNPLGDRWIGLSKPG